MICAGGEQRLSALHLFADVIRGIAVAVFKKSKQMEAERCEKVLVSNRTITGPGVNPGKDVTNCRL
jgi:hypothetical protein